MPNAILRANATPVYSFLSLIKERLAPGETLRGKKILDCGAGGILPPLVLFHQHGLETWGIDVSDEQLQRARGFCDSQSIQLNLRRGDMRDLPFEDETFDYVYEHYSMCHLSKSDTARAVGEMHQVLKKGGLCFLGVISADCWPIASFGEEREPGEFWMEEHGELARHSLFDDVEADRLVSNWEIVSKERHRIYLRNVADETSLEEWMDLYREAPAGHSPESWETEYSNRANAFHYTHLYYSLRKPT